MEIPAPWLGCDLIIDLHPPFGEVGILQIPLQGKQIQSAFLVEIVMTIDAVIFDKKI